MVVRFYRRTLFLLLPLMWLGGTALRPAPALHPFYISVTEINHNAADKSLEISCKIFTDDLESAIKKSIGATVDLSNGAQQERAGALVSQYVQQHLHMIANGKPVPIKFIGYEKEAESVYCYFEATGVAALKKLEISNSLLQDFTQEQINIMHITAGGRRQSTKLNFPAKEARFQF